MITPAPVSEQPITFKPQLNIMNAVERIRENLQRETPDVDQIQRVVQWAVEGGADILPYARYLDRYWSSDVVKRVAAGSRSRSKLYRILLGLGFQSLAALSGLPDNGLRSQPGVLVDAIEHFLREHPELLEAA